MLADAAGALSRNSSRSPQTHSRSTGSSNLESAATTLFTDWLLRHRSCTNADPRHGIVELLGFADSLRSDANHLFRTATSLRRWLAHPRLYKPFLFQAVERCIEGSDRALPSRQGLDV